MTKLRFLNSLIFPIVSYGSDCWVLKKKDKNRQGHIQKVFLKGCTQRSVTALGPGAEAPEKFSVFK